MFWGNAAGAKYAVISCFGKMVGARYVVILFAANVSTGIVGNYKRAAYLDH